MSGGRLVVLDRLGRDAKSFALAEGSASIGGDPSCDIRVLLPGVRPHHATVAVHAARALVRAVAGETLLNGAAVSVAALRHGDTLRLGGRALRWDYSRPPPPAPAPAPCLAVPRRGAAARARRRSEPPRRALYAGGRDSAPASTSTGGKQVAIVQPQRRDTSEAKGDPPPAGLEAAPPASARKSFPSKSPGPLPPDDPTKASLWIESRKPQPPLQSARNSPRSGSTLASTESTRVSRTRKSNVSNDSSKNFSAILRASADTSREASPRPSPRPSPRVSLRGSLKSAPLRLAVLKKAHSAQSRVTKIRAPLKIDHTKQAAIMLMTGHAGRPHSLGPPGRASPPARRPPGRASPPARRPPGRPSLPARKPPRCASAPAPLGSREPSPSRSPLLRESSYSTNPQDIPESDKPTPVRGRRSSRKTIQSPALASPKKSALKDPTAKKSTRKTESIKFDLSNLSTLSNLETDDENIVSDVVLDGSAEYLTDMSDQDITLHYSDKSSSKSPSPMKTVHSRSSRIIEKSLGSPMQTPAFERKLSMAQSTRSNRSLRGSIIVQKALNNSDSRYSRRTTKSLSDQSYSTTITSRISETLGQRASQNIESYSIVDLVSVDSNESGRSVYNSVGSHSTASFGTPGTVRRTRSTNASLLGSSTPYSKKTLSPKPSSSDTTKGSSLIKSRISTRRSASITTPENTQHISLNSTRISRPSRSRSCLNDSDVLVVNEVENEELSRRCSRRTSKNLLSPIARKNISNTVSSSDSPTNGSITPENMSTPQGIETPMLSIQYLLDQSSINQTSKPLRNSRNTKRSNVTRKTIGSIFTEPKKSRLSIKSRSLNLTGKRTLRGRRTPSGSLNGKDHSQDTEDAVTPTSAVKIVQEAVKNKHSTAKKPQSKRSLIDNLDDSDFVKQLFNSPVKRKLSQSMIEFSRKFFDDDVVKRSRSTRNTVALTGRTPDNSLLNNTQQLTTDIFVSPLNTSTNSPSLTGLKRLFRKNTPENDLRKVQGVKALLRTPRARKSINNDLSNVSGIKKIFGRSPRNRLSDVRVKEVFALSPTADLRRVSGVKALFQKSPLNDLRNISGVKRTLRANTPRNNLSDFRGVKQLFRECNEKNSSDVSGVEELPDESSARNDTFDRLLGRPPLRHYTKSNSCGRIDQSKKGRRKRVARSLHDSIGSITDNVEEWLENELKKRVQRPALRSDASKSTTSSNVTRELRKLHTDTVEGHASPTASRSYEGRKNSASEIYSARKLPLKKRSLTSSRRSRDSSLPLKKRALSHSTALPHSTVLPHSTALPHSTVLPDSTVLPHSTALPHSTVLPDSTVLPHSTALPRPTALPHSTPLRPAARGLSMNVSPIAAADEPRVLLQPLESPKPRATRGRKPKTRKRVMDDAEVVVVKPSPKRTRGRVIRNSPTRVQTRATRGKRTNDIKAVVTDESGPSTSISKKLPVMRSKPSPKITRTRKVLNFNNNIGNESKKTSIAKQKSQVKVPSKKTRSKVLKETVVVQKPSPQIKPRLRRQITERAESIQTEKPKKNENATIDQNNIKRAKTRNTKKLAEVQPTEQIDPPKPRRGRRFATVTEVISEDVPVKKRGRKAQEVQNISEIQNKRSRKILNSKKTKPIALETIKISRGKKEITGGPGKVAIVETSTLKLVETKTFDQVVRKSRRGDKDIENKNYTNNTMKRAEKPDKETRASKKSVTETAGIVTKIDGRKTRTTTAKEEINPAKAKKALRKRPAVEPAEGTSAETKKRRTRRAVLQGTS